MGVRLVLSPIHSAPPAPVTGPPVSIKGSTESRGCSPVGFPLLESADTATTTSSSSVASPVCKDERAGGTWRLPVLRNTGSHAQRKRRTDKPFDKRTIYDNADVGVVDDSADVMPGRKEAGLVPASRFMHCQEHNERRLIEKWRKTLRSPTRIGFAAQVMKDYKDPVPYNEPSYRLPAQSPRHLFGGQKAKSMDEVVENIALYRRGIARPVPKKYHQRTTCVDQNNNNTHFCDVLGPGACSYCIEKTNRKFASDVERTLPVINVDSVGMVAPRLSKLLCSSKDSSFEKTFNRMRTLTEKGDRRKRRLHIYLNVNGSCGMIEE